MQANVRDISKSNTDQTRGLNAHLETWASSNDWRERIITFNASWFTVSMGTGEHSYIRISIDILTHQHRCCRPELDQYSVSRTMASQPGILLLGPGYRPLSLLYAPWPDPHDPLSKAGKSNLGRHLTD